MKIGFSTFVMDGGTSGIAAYMCNLLAALQVEDRTNDYELLMARNEEHLVPLTAPRFRKERYPAWVNQPVLNLALHNMGFPQARYDLLHIPSYRRIPLLKRTRIVATVHDLAAFAVDAKYDRARMLFNRRLAPAMIRRADHVITVSEHTRNDLVRIIRYPEDNITVIPSGIDQALFRPQSADAARRILAEKLQLTRPFFVYVSRLEHPGKNHVRLIEAFERFKLENDSAHQLVLAGADWNGAALIRQRAAQSPVRDDIIFVGFAAKALVPKLYSAADLMIYPSLFEGFGLPIIEALACGTPVICSNTSSMKELAGNRLRTFNPLSAEEIFRTIEHETARGRNRAETEQNLTYAKTFDWNETARQVRRVYEAVG